MVTKWLYPDVAEQYKTNWKAVERNIRSIIALAWDSNPELLRKFSGYEADPPPWPCTIYFNFNQRSFLELCCIKSESRCVATAYIF